MEGMLSWTGLLMLAVLARNASGSELGVGGFWGLPGLLGVKTVWFPGLPSSPWGVQAELGVNARTEATQLLSARLEARYALSRDGLRAVPFLGLGLRSGDLAMPPSTSMLDTPLSVTGGIAGEFAAIPGGGITGELGLQWKFSGAASTPVWGLIFNVALLIWLDL